MKELNLSQKSIDRWFEKEEKIEFDRTHPKMKLEELVWAVGTYIATHGITQSNKMTLDNILKSLNIVVGSVTKQDIIKEFIGYRSQVLTDKKGVERESKPFSTIVPYRNVYYTTENHVKKKHVILKDCTVRMIRHNMRDEYTTTTKKGIYNNCRENVHKALLWMATIDAIGFENISSNVCTHMGNSYKPEHTRRILRENSFASFKKKYDMKKITGCDYYSFDTDPQLKETYDMLVKMRNDLIRGHDEGEE